MMLKNGHAIARKIDGPMSPCDLDAERSLLGTIMNNFEALHEVAPIIGTPKAFHGHANGVIYGAMLDMASAGKPVGDLVTLGDEIRRRGHADDVRSGYLGELLEAGMFTAANAVRYAQIIRSFHVAREVMRLGNQLAEDAAQPGATADEILESAERRLFQLTSISSSGELVGQDRAVQEWLEMLDRRVPGEDGSVKDTPVETQWTKLDAVIIGFHPGELVLIGARPGVGKSVVCLNLAVRVAERGDPVLFVALEQSREEQIGRQVAQRSGIGSWRLRRGIFAPDEKERIHDSADALRTLPIYYDDQPNQTLTRIGASVRKMKARGGLRLVIIDYLQLIDGSANPREPRHEVVGRISRYLKMLARESRVPIVAAAQVNRGSEERMDRRPRLSDLRESGSLEQDADTVILLHKPEPPDSSRSVDLLEVEIAKSRNGPTDRISLCHRKSRFEICNFATEFEP